MKYDYKVEFLDDHTVRVSGSVDMKLTKVRFDRTIDISPVTQPMHDRITALEDRLAKLEGLGDD